MPIVKKKEKTRRARRQPPPGNYSATTRLILDSLFEEGEVWPEDPDNVAVPLTWKDAGKDLQAFAAKRVRKELWESSGYDVDLWTAAEETRLYIKSKRTRPGPALATLGLQYCLDPKSVESLNQLARFRAQKQGGVMAETTAPTATAQGPAASGSTLGSTDSDTVEEVEEDAAPLKKENRPATRSRTSRRTRPL